MTERHDGAATIVRWALIYAVTEGATVAVAIALGATTAPLVTLAALFEGIVLGGAQAAFALGLRGRAALTWTAATAGGVVLGRLVEYFCATSPAATAFGSTPPAVQALAGSALGLLTGAIFVAFQAPLLGRSGHAARWPLVSAVAWAVTFPVILLVGIVSERLAAAPLLAQAAIDVVLFAAIGAVAGAVNGYGLRQFVGLVGAQRSSTARRLSSRTGFAR